MSIWDWVEEYRWRAMFEGNDEQLAMSELASLEALVVMDADPDQMLSMLEQAQAMARQLNEPWWELFCEHWKLQALLFRKRDYRAALPAAVKATVETRKPAYAHFPQRICLHEDLINAYVGIDPLGNEAAIENALSYMTQEINPELECWHCLHSLRVEFQIGRGRWNEALAEGLRYLATSDGGEYYECDAYNLLCEIALALGDDEKLAGWAREGEKIARRSSRELMLANLLAWRVLAARRAGDEKAARKLYQAAVTQAERLASVPSRTYYQALSAYLETAGELEQALQVRRQELEAIGGKGQLIAEYVIRRDQCRLLAQLGRPFTAELAQARQAAQALKNPAPYLAELDGVAGQQDI